MAKDFCGLLIRTLNDKSSYFNIQSQNDSFDFLPKGFLDRTKEQGLVVTSWAPQVEVLAHGSTCGFLSHIGWNLTLESIVHGVPLITWPLFAEQKMNTILLEEGLHVALSPKVNENGLVERADIGKVVKSLMGRRREEALQPNEGTEKCCQKSPK